MAQEGTPTRTWRRTGATTLVVVALLTAGLLAGSLENSKKKLPPPLVSELEYLLDHPQYDFPLPLIVKLNKSVGLPRGEQQLSRIHAYKTVKTAGQLYGLLKNPQVEYVTLDTVVRSSSILGGLTTSSYLQALGADLAQQKGFDGAGVGVAVFDSGIVETDFAGRVVQRLDFTSGTAQPVSGALDAYGHGSHVAGIIGGDGTSSAGLYRGVAPGVNLVSLQVVEADGAGRASNLIAAIDWAIRNKDAYNIRVANLSLGSPPLDSYVNDPICQAVDSLVAAGIVAVVSAGNFGKTAEYPEIWRSITSPGNSPAVITVGAVNTMDTADLDDDVATSFSSRGPTFPDGLFKPDLSAPGNAIPSVKALGSWLDVNLPQYHITGYPNYLRLSGSSMATAFVSGTAALMIQSNPDLSPRLIKALLLLTAVKLTQPHVLEQGNGLVNTLAAVQLAELTDVPGRSIATQLVAPYRTRNGKRIWAGGAMAAGTTLLFSNVVSASGPSHWGGGANWASRLSWTSGTPWSGALFHPNSDIWDTGFIWSDGAFWTESTGWEGEAIAADGVIWAETVFWTNGLVWVDGAFWVEGCFWTDSASGGDL